MKLSASPDRFSFQKIGYVKRQAERNEDVNENYLKLFEQMINDHEQKFESPDRRINNLEYDLRTTDWILAKARCSDAYAQNLYSALCNNEFIKNDVWPILADQTWHCSWRYAGGIVADMREKGDYIDWYCSGIRDQVRQEEIDELSPEEKAHYAGKENKYVGEGFVTDEIKEDLFKLGWVVIVDRDQVQE